MAHGRGCPHTSTLATHVTPARLHPDDIAALARALAVELRGEDDAPIPEGATLTDARHLARRYQLSEKWVAKHATELGATPISDSRNSKLRFHLATADAFMDSRRRHPVWPQRSTGGRKPKQRPARTHTASGLPRLPVPVAPPRRPSG